MALHDFHGPVTNDKTAIFLKAKGLPENNATAVTAATSLVKEVDDETADDDRWGAVKTWAGADDGSVVRLPAAITDMPTFYAPPNRLNVETYDANNQTIQVLGIGQTPDLDLTISLFDPAGDAGHAALAQLAEGTMMDVCVLTATTWKAKNTFHIDGTALEAGGFGALVVTGKPYYPLGGAGDYSQLTVPMAFKGITASRIVASY